MSGGLSETQVQRGSSRNNKHTAALAITSHFISHHALLEIQSSFHQCELIGPAVIASMLMLVKAIVLGCTVSLRKASGRSECIQLAIFSV